MSREKVKMIDSKNPLNAPVATLYCFEKTYLKPMIR